MCTDEASEHKRQDASVLSRHIWGTRKRKPLMAQRFQSCAAAGHGPRPTGHGATGRGPWATICQPPCSAVSTPCSAVWSTSCAPCSPSVAPPSSVPGASLGLSSASSPHPRSRGVAVSSILPTLSQRAATTSPGQTLPRELDRAKRPTQMPCIRNAFVK